MPQILTRRKADRLPTASPDERDLVARAARRDPAAVADIVRHYNRRLFRLARSVVRDDADAEDVLQQAYIKAFAAIGRFRGEAKLSTWLSRIVLNEAIATLRNRRPAGQAVGEDHLERAQVIPFPNSPPRFDPERDLAQRQITAILERAIDELPAAFRTVLVARVVEGMSVEETAALLDIRPETVKTRLHRARRMVRLAMERRFGSTLTEAFPFDGWRCERMTQQIVASVCGAV